MYRVTIYNGSESVVIHEPTVDPRDPHLLSCTLTQGSSGEIDSLQFDILPNNPGYDLLQSRGTMITVTDITTTPEQNEFIGRVLTITPQMEDTGLVYKTVVCEDRLGYLCDSIQPYLAEDTYTVADFFTMLLENHNSQVEDYKKIYPGMISMNTSSGNVTKGLNYQTTWEALREKLLNSIGGEIQLYAGTDGLLYLDYVQELGTRKDQTIELGKNMRTISQSIDPTSVITRLIPLGAKPEVTEDNPDVDVEDRLTIASVNGGKIYLDDEAAQEVYGIVEGTVYWDDVTLPENLLERGQEWLDNQTIEDAVSLTALDLSLIGLEPDTIERYNYYRTINSAIGMDTYLRVVKVVRDIVEPENVTYSMGTQAKSLASTLTDASNRAASAAGDAEAAINAELSKTVTALIVSNAMIQELQATVAYIETAYVTYEEVGTLVADLVQAAIGEFDFLTVEEADIRYAAIGDLTAINANITNLEAQVATIQNAYVDFETVETLLANYATIADLSAIYASIDVLEAGYAKIEELEAAVANIDSLTASVANINYLLSGYTSTGDLTAIHITTENAVIDSEVVMNLIAEDAILGTLMAGVIYTDYVTIMSSDGNYINTGSTEQFLDENGTIRIQIGMDASGTYNFYIAGEDGELLWDALGLTEEGLTANGAIVKDAAVADDANISGYKLNIEEICTIINDNGEYTFDAASITIDGQGLDAWYVEINSAIEGLEGMTTEGLKSITRYYTYWDSDTEAPPDDENLTPAICGEAICGLTICGKTDGTLWQIEPIAAQEGLYRWCKLLGEYIDGHTEWGLPYCLDDGYERSQTQVLQTELNVVQGQIEAKIWEDDIITYIDPIYGELTIINDEYATITVELGNINLSLGNLTTTVYEVQDIAEAASAAAGEAQSTAEAAADAAQAAQDAAAQAASDAADAQTKADQAAADAATAAQDAEDAQARADAAKEAADAAQAEYDELKDRADATDDELAEAQEKLAQALADAEQAQADANQAAADAENAADIAKEAQNAADQASADAKAAQDTADQALADAAEAKNAADAASELAKAVQEELGNVSVEVESMSSQITEIVMEIGNITARVDSVDSLLVTIGTDIDAIREELAALDGLEDMIPYFCLWSSGTEAPPDDETLTPAICGEAVCGLTICGLTEGTIWIAEDEPDPQDGLYRWIKWKLIFQDGSESWSAAYCLDDTYTRRQISIVSDQYATLTIELDSIKQEVGDVQTIVTENYTYLSEQIATLEVTTSSISGTIVDLTETVQTVFDEVTGIQEQVIAIDSQVTSIIADTDGIRMDVENLQADITTIGTSLDEIESRIESLDGLQEWIPYWCLWDSGTEAPPDDDELTPAICGQAVCGLTICGVTDGILWKEDEPPTQDGLYEWVKYKLIYQDGTVEWWGPYCISDVYVRAQIDATWAQLNVLDDRITAQVAELHETIDGEYESLSLSISNVTQTAYEIQSTVADLSLEFGEVVVDLSSQITQTATEIRQEVSAVQSGLESQITQTSTEILSEVADVESGLASQIDQLSGEITQAVYDLTNDFESQITQLANSISLSVSYGGDGTASIVLTVDGEDAGDASVVTSARAAFQNESTQCIISAGRITFNSNTLVVNSTNFTLDANGNATFSGTLNAPSGTIGGWTIGTSALYDGTDSMSSTTAGLYLGTNGIRNYGTMGYVNITSGYVRNGSASGSNYVQMNSASLEMYYSGTLLGSYATTYWVDDSSKRGLSIHLEYAADFIAFGRKSSSTASSYTTAYIINYGIDSSTLGYSERHIFYGTARVTSYLYVDRIYPGGTSNSSYYFTSMSYNGTVYGLYTNGTLSTVGAVYIGNTIYDGFGTYMLNINGDTYASGHIISGSYLKVQTSYGACSLYTNSSYYGLYDSNAGRFFAMKGSSGNTYFGNMYATTVLYGDGVYLNGTSTAVTSDRSLKNDISPLSTKYDDLVEHLTPRAYTMKEGGDEKHIGFVVDEVEAAMKEAGMDPDDYGLTDYFTDESGEKIGAIRYEEIIPMLVHEIQTLRERIAALEN